MMEEIKESIRLNKILHDRYGVDGKGDDSKLNQLYMKLFSTDDGKLILQDLANRCFMHIATIGNNEAIYLNEGMRSVFLTIRTRIVNAQDGAEKEG